MFYLMREATMPRLGLARCIGNWPQISHDLREASRKRLSQVVSLRQAILRLS